MISKQRFHSSNTHLLLPLIFVFLSSCGNHNTPPIYSLEISQEIPLSVRSEMLKAYEAFPDRFKKGKRDIEFIFTSSNGKVYSSKGNPIRTGRIVKDGYSLKVQFDDGSEDIPYPKDESNASQLSAKGTNYPKCDPSSGPFYRSWSNSGYNALDVEAIIRPIKLPPKVNGKPWAAYQYLGGQAANGSSEVDAGIAFQNNSFRIFSNYNKQYREYGNKIPFQNGSEMKYKLQLFVYSENNLGLSTDNPDGSTILEGFGKVYGFNENGNDQYFKRMVTIANNALEGIYDGTQKYNAQNTGIYRDTRLGKGSDDSFKWINWSNASISYQDCKWPNSNIVQLKGGSPSSNLLNIDIDMSR